MVHSSNSYDQYLFSNDLDNNENTPQATVLTTRHTDLGRYTCTKDLPTIVRVQIGGIAKTYRRTVSDWLPMGGDLHVMVGDSRTISVDLLPTDCGPLVADQNRCDCNILGGPMLADGFW